MYNTTPPSGSDLPSSRTLLRSTVLAVALAIVLLITVVLPAEYAVDPTGVGEVLGLTEMGEIKMQLAREAVVADSIEAALAAAGVSDTTAESGAAAETLTAEASTTPTDRTTPLLAHISEISLDPDEGLEIKLLMKEGARVRYAWSTSGGVVNYDTHADNESIDYFSYATGNAVPSDEGVLVAAFDGYHGWFWRNRTDGEVSVTLRTEGDYQELKMP